MSAERIDVGELLASERIRFWAVVCSGPTREPVRRALCYPPAASFGDVLRDLDIPLEAAANWSVSIRPSPRKTPQPDAASQTRVTDLQDCDPPHSLVSSGL